MLCDNPFAAMLAAKSIGKRPMKVPNLKSSRLSPIRMKRFLSKNALYWKQISIGPSNVLYTGMYMCTFQPGYLTGCVGEGVKSWSRSEYSHASPTALRMGKSVITTQTADAENPSSVLSVQTAINGRWKWWCIRKKTAREGDGGRHYTAIHMKMGIRPRRQIS